MTVKEYSSKLAGLVMVSSIHGAWTLYRGPGADLPPELCDLEVRCVHGCLTEIDGMLYPQYPGGATRLWVDENSTTSEEAGA